MPNKSAFTKLSGNSKPPICGSLMPLEIKRHTVPHLKALTHSIEHTNRHELGSTFKQHCTDLKSSILLHKMAKRQSHVTVAVHKNKG